MTTPARIPGFEGRTVEAVRFKVTGAVPLDDLDQSVSIDDRVQLLSVYVVTGVRHIVDEKTGNLIREHTLKAQAMNLLPFDENDPDDDGIIRAIPQGSVKP